MGSSPYSPVIPLVICLPRRPLTGTLMAPGRSQAFWLADRPACPPPKLPIRPLTSMNFQVRFSSKKAKEAKTLTLALAVE